MLALISVLFCFCSLLTAEQVGDELSDGLEQSGGQWPNAEVPFEFRGNFSPAFDRAFTQAVNEIHEKTCVRFRERTPLDRFFLRIVEGEGCWSYVGMLPELAAEGQALSLGRACEKKGVILHELMHTLGFFHEHTRFDRDDHVVLNAQNIAPEHTKQFHRRAKHKTDDLSPYDLGSILHYEEGAFALDPALPTITPRSAGDPERPMGQREALSKWDVQKINLLYNCTGVAGEVQRAIETGLSLNEETAVEKPARSMKQLRPKAYFWFRSAGDFQRRTGKQPPTWLRFATFADDAQQFPRAIQCGTTDESNCQDRSTDCLEWALRGECERKPGFMLRICRRSCCNCNDSKCFDTNDERKFRTLCLGRFKNPAGTAEKPQVSACELEVTRRNALDFCPQSCGECFRRPSQ